MTAAFTIIKIRIAAVIVNNGQVALIKRDRADGTQYTLPGGNVEPAESLLTALWRELDEELGLRLATDTTPALLAVQDQMVSRPGDAPPPRKLHLIFRIDIDDTQRAGLAVWEEDDLSAGEVVWLTLTDATGLHLFPAVGELLASIDLGQPACSALLPALTDDTYQWR
jgi:ADP-ribose pyrophosphatase YjhB (NUDIX family)